MGKPGPNSKAASICFSAVLAESLNDFPALHAVVSKAEECAGGAVTFAKNHTAKHQELQGPALTANPAEYTAKIVTNGSIVPLLTDGLLRPLDDLVAKHGQSLGKNQLITIDGKITRRLWAPCRGRSEAFMISSSRFTGTTV